MDFLTISDVPTLVSTLQVGIFNYLKIVGSIVYLQPNIIQGLVLICFSSDGIVLCSGHCSSRNAVFELLISFQDDFCALLDTVKSCN